MNNHTTTSADESALTPTDKPCVTEVPASKLALLAHEELLYPNKHGDMTLETKPPTPALQSHLVYDEKFITILTEQLEKLRKKLLCRVEIYGMGVEEWLQGHEPEDVLVNLRSSQAQRRKEKWEMFEQLSDTESDDEETKRHNNRRKRRHIKNHLCQKYPKTLESVEREKIIKRIADNRKRAGR